MLSAATQKAVRDAISLSADALIDFEILDAVPNNVTGELAVLVKKRFSHNTQALFQDPTLTTQWVRVGGFKSYQ